LSNVDEKLTVSQLLVNVTLLQPFGGFVVKWRISRQYLKRFVDHRYFSRGILLAILVNTLSMGIEYHNQA